MIGWLVGYNYKSFHNPLKTTCTLHMYTNYCRPMCTTGTIFYSYYWYYLQLSMPKLFVMNCTYNKSAVFAITKFNSNSSYCYTSHTLWNYGIWSRGKYPHEIQFIYKCCSFLNYLHINVYNDHEEYSNPQKTSRFWLWSCSIYT